MTLFRLMWSFFRIGAMNELQYRVNFFVQLFQSFLALVVGLVGLALVFNYTSELAGWSRPELLVVMGVFILMGGLIRTAIQPNMERLMADVQEGTLDYALTKPADAQIIVSVREVRIWQSVDILVGAVVMVVALLQLNGIELMEALQFLLVSLELAQFAGDAVPLHGVLGALENRFELPDQPVSALQLFRWRHGSI